MDKVTPIGSPKGKSKSPARRSPSVKSTEAYQLRVSGRLPVEIAEILGMPRQEVDRLLAERFNHDASYLSQQQRDTILGMELVRLEALQTAVWPSAMLGDPKSVDSALKIIQTRAKITGLEQADPVTQKNLVLVMGDKEADYIAALKAVSDD